MITQYIQLIKNPLLFFKWDVEKNYLRLLLFFLAPFIILFSTEIILTIILEQSLTLERALFILVYLVVSAFLLASFLGIYSYLTYLGALFFNKKASYLNSFKAAIFGLVHLIPYLFVLMVVGFINFSMPSPISNSIYYVFSLILPVVGYTHALVIQVLAVLYYNKISAPKAFASVIIPVLVVFLMAIVITFLYLYFSLN
jgi:hypothetical protein